MRHPGFWIGVLAIALAPVLGGQTLGNYVFRPNSSAVNRPIPFTIIDLGSGATGAGTIGAVAFHWSSGASCPNAMKVKFFRRTHSNFTMIAERGPFSVTSNHQT
ncbi:MAG TPA: hypothetical protein VM534_04540, partial [Thermoanaerobaculia bacterium]|nr:hypothetical protein [Thermoanaerobaculia bacterium]